MGTKFEANALAVLIGSLPVSAHEEAHRLVMNVSVFAGHAGADH